MADQARTNRCMHYKCPRCGHISKQFSNYKQHIQRKRMCKPTMSDNVPTLQNMQVVRHVHGGDNPATVIMENHGTITITQNIDNSTHAHHSTHTTHTHMHHHTHQLILAFGEEDKSFLTPEFLRGVITSDEDQQTAFQDLVQLVHFTPCKPENMNVYAKKDGGVYDAKVFKQEKWTPNQRTTTVAEQMAANIARAIQRIFHLVPLDNWQDKAEEWSDFLKDVSLANDGDVADAMAERLKELSYLVASCHPEVLREPDS